MDEAGRVVVPRALRERLGPVADPVELEVDGSGKRLSPGLAADLLAHLDGRLVIAPGGSPLADDDVRALRDADRR